MSGYRRSKIIWCCDMADEPDADDRGGPSDNDADDKKKRTKESVNYSKGTPTMHCGICKHYEVYAKNECELVEGHIVPSYWCRLFEKARITGGMGRHLKVVR